MGPTVAFTLAIGEQARTAARVLRRTFKAHHPEIPFLLIDDSFYAAFSGQEEIAHAGEIVGLRLVIGYFLSRLYGRIIYLDSDVLVLDRLPALFETAEPIVLTHDVRGIDYGLPIDPINIGVFSAASSEFWRRWVLTNYSYLLPPVGIFFDQFSLRVLCMQKLLPYSMVPEHAERDYYNIGYNNCPGDWHWDGAQLRKGEARVRLWHWAGYSKKTAIGELPPPVGLAFQAVLDHKPVTEEARAVDRREMERFRAIVDFLAPLFRMEIRQEFAILLTYLLKNLIKDDEPYSDKIYISDAPASLDAWRPALAGVHRRFLPRACRYIYSPHPNELWTAEADAFDVPWIVAH